jgi:hypothetical protein
MLTPVMDSTYCTNKIYLNINYFHTINYIYLPLKNKKDLTRRKLYLTRGTPFLVKNNPKSIPNLEKLTILCRN